MTEFNLIGVTIALGVLTLLYGAISCWLDKNYTLTVKYLKSKDEYYDYLKWKDER